jgi:hypothetical protein
MAEINEVAERHSAQIEIDKWMGNHGVKLPIQAYHSLLRYVGKVAVTGRASREWPLLDKLHLEAIVFAYNEGYSKAIEGRVFPNPFSEAGSQAEAWALGTRDGGEQRQQIKNWDEIQPVINLSAFALATLVLEDKTLGPPLHKIATELLELLEKKNGRKN